MDFKYKNINSIKGFGNDILLNILKARGIQDTNLFLNLTDKVLEDYKNYDNMDIGSKTYLKHVNDENKIGIVIDFDCDGFTSASEMYLYTKDVCNKLNKSFNVEYLMHDHKSHGLDNNIMKLIEKGNYKLLLIPDAGTNDYKQHEKLKQLGMDIICLDHHQSKKYSDDAIIINNQLSNKIKNKSMTGVGVVYKFCKYIDEILGVNYADKYLDIVSIGMIADSADLRDLESRYLVLEGLKLIQSNTNKNRFISTLFKEKSYSMNNIVTIIGVAFYMCPAINCIIRGGNDTERDILFKAFIGTSDTYIDKIRGKGEVEMGVEDYAIRLYTKLKRKQDKLVDKEVTRLSEQIEKYKLNQAEIMVIDGRDNEDNTFNRVIINKLADKYKKHGMLLTNVKDKQGVLGGSASGCKNKEISDLRTWCEQSKLFIFSQGHPNAFGVQISENNVQQLYNIISQIPTEDVLTYIVDGIFDENNLSDNIVKMIGNFDTVWGNKLDEPLFALENLNIPSSDVMIMGKNKTTLKINYNNISLIKFKSSEDEYNEIIKNDNNKFTIIGRFKINEYNGNTYGQILIENYKFEKTNEVKTFRF